MMTISRTYNFSVDLQVAARRMTVRVKARNSAEARLVAISATNHAHEDTIIVHGVK